MRFTVQLITWHCESVKTLHYLHLFSLKASYFVNRRFESEFDAWIRRENRAHSCEQSSRCS